MGRPPTGQLLDPSGAELALSGLIDAVTATVEARLRTDPKFIASVAKATGDTVIQTSRDRREPTIEPRWYRRREMLADLDGISTSSQDLYRQRGFAFARPLGRANLYDRYAIIGLSELIRKRIVTLGPRPQHDERALKEISEHVAECQATEAKAEQFLSSYAVRRLAEARAERVAARLGL